MSRGFTVRSLRNMEYFVVDNIYLNGYAKKLGVHATSVYLSLCRHANGQQIAFPSQELIAKETGMGKRTVVNKLKLLEEYNMVRVDKQRNKKGEWIHNIYYLIDRTQWKDYPSAAPAPGPSAADDIHQVQLVHTNKPNIKNTNTNVFNGHAKKTVSCPLSKNTFNGKFTGGHKECIEYLLGYEDERPHKFTNKPKQFFFLHKLLRAEVDFDDINKVIKKIEQHRGKNQWDFSTVANWIDKGAVYG